MKKIEILAPVGNKECLISAIMAGCDAVYLSGNMFGARTFADNFDYAGLKEAVEYAHIYNVKVYITVNTVIYDKEIEMFLSYVDYLVSINVDALIIQDLGMLDLIHRTYPKLELHASTQMHVHNLNGAKLVKKLGAKRVVLARELSLEQIKQIKNNVDLEIEVFTHGALCVSYSSQCLMSSLIGNRSGNRGSCAGSCRQLYSLVKLTNNKEIVITENKYLLSMKDLNTINNIDKLLESGIDSLKIEGRMKRSSYVFMVVSMYRKAVDNYFKTKKVKVDTEDLIKLSKIFDRGSTKGFLFDEELTGVVNTYRPNHMGVEIGTVISYQNNFVKIKLSDSVSIFDGIRILSEQDYGLELNVFSIGKNIVKEAHSGDEILIKVKSPIKIGSKVVKTTDYKDKILIDKIIESKPRKINVDLIVDAVIDKKMALTIICDNEKIKATSEYIISEASNSPVTQEKIVAQLNKLGNTVYKINDIKCNISDNIFIPNKVINDLRREVVDKLNTKRLYREPLVKKDIINYDIKVELEKGNTIKLYDDSLINVIDQTKFIDIYTHYQDKTYIDNNIPFTINVLNEENNYSKVKLIGDLGSVKEGVITDYSFNVTNSYTVALLHNLGVKRVTLSYEMEEEDIKLLVDNYKSRYKNLPNLELIVFGKVEAMHLKYQIEGINNIDSFAIKDRFNNLYLLKNIDDVTFIFNHQYRKIVSLDKYRKIGINIFRYQLINEEDFNNYIKIKE